MELAKKSWRVEQGHHVRVSRLLLHKGYTRLESAAPAAGDDDDQEYDPWTQSNAMSPMPLVPGEKQQQQKQRQRRKWRFRVRPKVRVLYSTISTLVRRLRDSYARVMLALAAKTRDGSLLPLAYKKTPRSAAIGHGGWSDTRQLNDVETKYLEYIKRSVADGELAYYTVSLRNTSIF